MKNLFLFPFVFVSFMCFSQSISNYKAVIIPLKYDFLKTENQYRLATITKFNLQKAGFVAFYANESLPSEFAEKCSVLSVDVQKINAFLITKLMVVFKDCYGKVIYQSEIGKSKEKDYEKAYTAALNEAFQSIYALNYKYEGKMDVKSVAVTTSPISVPQTAEVKKESNEQEMLYAQPTSTGYQLVDNTPKVVFKLNKTSSPTFFTASKGSIQGVFIQKENDWFFEYYENEKLISERVAVKF